MFTYDVSEYNSKPKHVAAWSRYYDYAHKFVLERKEPRWL
jgi:hypothetical protein